MRTDASEAGPEATDTALEAAPAPGAANAANAEPAPLAVSEATGTEVEGESLKEVDATMAGAPVPAPQAPPAQMNMATAPESRGAALPLTKPDSAPLYPGAEEEDNSAAQGGSLPPDWIR